MAARVMNWDARIGLEPQVETGERAPGGAKLLFVAKGVRGKAYREVVQERVDEEALRRLEERVATAAEGIAGATFAGVVDLGDRDPHAAYGYRIHLVPAVSA